MDSAVANGSRLPSVGLVPELPDVEDTWVLTEETMPESNVHRDIVDLLRLILLAFIVGTARHALAAANLACRWNVAKHRVEGSTPTSRSSSRPRPKATRSRAS